MMAEVSMRDLAARIQEHLDTKDESEVIRYVSELVDREIVLESQSEDDWTEILKEQHEL